MDNTRLGRHRLDRLAGGLTPPRVLSDGGGDRQARRRAASSPEEPWLHDRLVRTGPPDTRPAAAAPGAVRAPATYVRAAWCRCRSCTRRSPASPSPPCRGRRTRSSARRGERGSRIHRPRGEREGQRRGPRAGRDRRPRRPAGDQIVVVQRGRARQRDVGPAWPPSVPGGRAQRSGARHACRNAVPVRTGIRSALPRAPPFPSVGSPRSTQRGGSAHCVSPTK